jgi:hypothetical protein
VQQGNDSRVPGNPHHWRIPAREHVDAHIHQLDVLERQRQAGAGDLERKRHVAVAAQRADRLGAARVQVRNVGSDDGPRGRQRQVAQHVDKVRLGLVLHVAARRCSSVCVRRSRQTWRES